MEVSHFKVSTHIFKKYHFWMKCCSVWMKCCSYNFLHNWWPFMVTTVFNCVTCRVFTSYLFTKGRWRSLILKFQLISSQKVPFLDEVLQCVEWNAAVLSFYIIDGHVWSLQCSIVIHAEFLHHIYLLKEDGSLSF